MTKALKNHPGMWLRDDAADAINALEDKYGVIRINRAGVTEASQQATIDQWDRGDRAGFAGPPARPASSSNHVKNGGTAVDVYNYTSDRAKLNEFGFEWYGSGDVVHYTYTGNGGTSGRGGYADGSAELGIFQDKLIRMGHDLGASGADRVFGAKTEAATRFEQSMAAKNGYPGGALKEDGIPGPATNGYLDWWLNGHPSSVPSSGHIATVGDLASLPYVNGLQKLAQRYGYNGGIDNDFGGGSQAGLQSFLNNNYGGSLANWLRTRWGYVGNDVWGPDMAAAATRADTANWNEL